MNRFNSHSIRQTLVILILVGIVFGCIDGDLLAPDPDAPIITDFAQRSGFPGSNVIIQGEKFSGKSGSVGIHALYGHHLDKNANQKDLQ